ncbi:MAG: SBBP repeat-containing protein, partial [Candidatus Thorarchaeota archaeon]|nr:SBBP repeat-containing protein [Candidatus Thorarchaeota archaeon]
MNLLTYFGTSSSDEVRSMAIDDNGDIVIAGQTTSYEFPLVNAAQETRSSGLDIFVTKLSGENHSIIFSTYYGGGGNEYLGSDIAIDSEGNIIIGGATASRNLPLLHPYQIDHGGGELDAFIVKYSPSGTLLYSSYLGGSALDRAYGMSVDSEDNFVFTGHMT